jgi:hypothetical protein
MIDPARRSAPEGIMRAPFSHAGAAALLLAATLAACSHGKKEAPAPPPAPPPKPTAAEESQKSFELARQEQAALVEQQKKVEASHAAVIAAQDQLAKAQVQEQQDRVKAQQLQEQASQHLQEGVRSAQRAQAGLAGSAAAAEGLQTVAGTVTQASSSQVVLQTPGGKSMAFAVDDHTRVLLGTESRSVTDIQRGADAQVAFDPKSGGQMTALIIRVMPAGGARGGAGAPRP